MRERAAILEDGPERRRRRAVTVLAVLAVVLWTLAVALAATVLVLITDLPGVDPGRTPRALAIAASVFALFGLPAIGVTIALVHARRSRVRGREV